MQRVESLLMVVVILGSIVFGGKLSFAITEDLMAEEMIKRLDENLFFASARYESEIIIRQGQRERVLEMVTYSKSDGEEYRALTEFMDPRNRGTKYLMIGNDLWMYFPQAEEIVSISGHMLREGMMGSDFSYKDVLESTELLDLYSFELEGEEMVDGQMSYILLGTAKEDREVLYYQRKAWIHQEDFTLLREELFSPSGRLLKVLEIKEIKEFEDGRLFPVQMVMRDKLRQDSETLFHIKKIEFDYPIPDGFISLDSLQ